MPVSLQSPGTHLARESGTAPIDALIEALQQYDVLTDHDLEILSALPVISKSFAKGSVVMRNGDRPTHSCLLLSGYASRALLFADGRCQITSLHIPGDLLDLSSLFLKRLDHSVVAFSDCEMGFIPHHALRHMLDHHPHLMHLFWLTTLIEAAIDRAWIGCLGRRPAADHMAHFFCETYTRLRGRRLAGDNSFSFDATQSELGDVLGMSVVHVNRTIQDLRRLGLISWENGVITITNFADLAARAEFDPAYLYHYVEDR